MVQSRAQFGFYGALLPSVMVVLMYLGFAVEGSLVAGQAIAPSPRSSHRSSRR
ncbi:MULTISPECIES: cytosine permease [Streptomyces]|uniref:cytosine permease n=1 Tax=Streptomyces TaxID=1883 RepID=UPI0026C3744C